MVMKHLGLYIYSLLQSVVMKDFGLVFWDDAKHTQIMFTRSSKVPSLRPAVLHACYHVLLDQLLTQACPMVMKHLGLYIYSVLG